MPNWTNALNIDPTIAQAVMEDDYELVGHASVTGILRPAQIAALESAHSEEITEDIADARHRFFGKMAHQVLANLRTAGTIKEHLLTINVLGWNISGHFDIWYETGALKDFKFTSVWAYIYGRREWQEQVNIYAYMAEQAGLEVKDLAISAMFYDWKKQDKEGKADYPHAWAVDIPVERWPSDFTQRFLEERVRVHQAAQGVIDGLPGDIPIYPPCTTEERWARPDTWAVMKRGAKRAYRVFESKFKANELHSQLSGYDVVYRPGENVRCGGYCPVRPWCVQADELGVPRE